MIGNIDLLEVIYYVFLIIILLVSVGLHEYAHARSSYKLGDPTPVLQGRLTPNPFKHVDIIGFLSIFLIGFGWGRPVQINPRYYKNPVVDELKTSLAGPVMNLVLAFVGMCIMMVYSRIVGIGVQNLLMVNGDLVIMFWQMFIMINISLAVFNLIPLPPLDGYRLIKIFRKRGANWMEKNVTWISLVLIILIVSGSPIISGYISTVSDMVYRLFFMLFSLIFY